MKWLVAFLEGILLSALSIFALSAFGSVMRKKIQDWTDAEFALGFLPQLLVHLHYFLIRYSLIITPLIFVLCIASTFFVTFRKKKSKQ